MDAFGVLRRADFQLENTRYLVEVAGMSKYGTTDSERDAKLRREKRRIDGLATAGYVLLNYTAREVLPHPLLLLWVAINVGERPDGVMTGHTVGLNSVGLMDIEIPQTQKTAEETFAFLVDLADYLLTNGLVIKDGDSVGESKEETIRAVYAVSLLDPEKTVIQLQSDMPYVEAPAPEQKGFFARLFGK